MLCESCKGTWQVDQLKDEGAHKEQASLDTVEYVCPSCGASVHSSQTTATSFCSFCGSEVVFTERLSHMRRPDRILPFRITREECESIYRNKLKSSPFAPKSLLAQETIDHFRPVYIPYWNYSFQAQGVVAANGTKRYSDSSYNYVDTYSYDLSCVVNISDMIYDASSAFEDETAQKLNFITGGLSSGSDIAVPFHPAYLCGMYAEAPDADPVIYKDHLAPFAEEELNASASERTGADVTAALPEQRTTDTHLMLLPVWLLANRQGGRILYTAINGDSGEIVCDTPVSKSRFALLTAGLFAAFLALLLLITHVVILRPNMLLGFCSILAAAGFHLIVRDADRILTRRQRDTDPTRAMKKRKSQDEQDSSIANSEEMTAMMRSAKKVKKRKKTNSISAGTTAVLAVVVFCFILWVLGMLFGSGKGSRLLGMLISDRGLLVPIILIVSLVLLFLIRYRYPSEQVDPGKKKSGITDVLLLYAMRGLVIAGLVISIAKVPGVSLWLYLLSILILILLSVSMIRVFLLHNEYVTRPVPFFGKEAEE